MLKIENIRELNGMLCGEFKLSYCDFLVNGSDLVRHPHYQIQFNKTEPIGKAQPAVLTIEADVSPEGKYPCKLFYGTTDNIIWSDRLDRDTLRKRNGLLSFMANILYKEINK